MCPFGYRFGGTCRGNRHCDCIKNSERGCAEGCARKLCEYDSGKWIPKDDKKDTFTCEIGMNKFI